MLPYLGCDVSFISEINKRNLNHQLAQRILSELEFKQYASYPKPRQEEFLAGRFCAKEALIKALPIQVGMKEIHIYLQDQQLWTQVPGFNCRVSISHFQDVVMAVAIGEPHD